MEEQRKNSYDPNEDIVDRMWKRSKYKSRYKLDDKKMEEIKKQHQSGHRRMQYSGIPCSHTDRRDRELQTYDGLRCGVCAAD